MKSATPEKTDAEKLVDHLEQLDEAVPLDDAEVEILLKEAGINLQAALKSALDVVDEAERRAKQQRYAVAEQMRDATIRRLQVSAPKRSRTELQQKISYFQQTLPREAQPHANFKGLESMPDEDLEMLVTELELLASTEHEPK